MKVFIPLLTIASIVVMIGFTNVLISEDGGDVAAFFVLPGFFLNLALIRASWLVLSGKKVDSIFS